MRAKAESNGFEKSGNSAKRTARKAIAASVLSAVLFTAAGCYSRTEIIRAPQIYDITPAPKPKEEEKPLPYLQKWANEDVFKADSPLMPEYEKFPNNYSTAGSWHEMKGVEKVRLDEVLRMLHPFGEIRKVYIQDKQGKTIEAVKSDESKKGQTAGWFYMKDGPRAVVFDGYKASFWKEGEHTFHSPNLVNLEKKIRAEIEKMKKAGDSHNKIKEYANNELGEEFHYLVHTPTETEVYNAVVDGLLELIEAKEEDKPKELVKEEPVSPSQMIMPTPATHTQFFASITQQPEKKEPAEKQKEYEAKLAELRGLSEKQKQEYEAKTKQLDDKLKEYTKKADEQSRQLQDKSKEIDNLNARIDKYEKAKPVDEQKKQKEYEANVKRLEAAVEQQIKENKEKDNQLQGKSEEIKKLEARFEAYEKNKSVAEQGKLKEYEANLAELKGTAEKQKQEYEAILSEQKSSAEKQKKEYEAKTKQLDDKLKEYAGKIESQNTKLREQTNEMDKLKARIAEYTAQLAKPRAATPTVQLVPPQKQITAAPKFELNCEDTDSGMDYFKRGTITFIGEKTGNRLTKDDKCMEDGRLEEYYCKNNEAMYQRIVCKTIGGIKCDNGMCIK